MTIIDAAVSDMRLRNATAQALTKRIDSCEAAGNILRLAREELTAKGETTRYFALVSAARVEIAGVQL